MKIVVDTNIVFSAMLNSSSKIAKILITANTHFQFYSCNFLQIELIKHKNKLQKLTKLSDDDLQELQLIVTKNIYFVNEKLIPREVLDAAEIQLMDIDINDTPFVALANYIDAKLWTGDMKLYKGLKAKKVKNIYTTLELSMLLDDLENE